MVYIIGRKADKKLLETTGIAGAVDIASYKAAIAKNHGGIADDYSILSLSENTTEIERIKAGHEYKLVWVADTITGVSFADFDTKIRISFKTDKTEILADGKEIATVEAALVDSNNNPVNDTVPDVYIPVQTSRDVCRKKVSIVNGKAKFDFMTTMAGTWKFPATGVTIQGYRVHNQITVEALLI